MYTNGASFFTSTVEDGKGNTSIFIRKAASLAGLSSAPDATVWTDTDRSRSHQMWGPNLHSVASQNKWCLDYTATGSDSADEKHRSHVLESAGSDPLGPYSLKARLYAPNKDGDAIDANLFQRSGGQLYLLWVGPRRQFGQGPGPGEVRVQRAPDPLKRAQCAEPRRERRDHRHAARWRPARLPSSSRKAGGAARKAASHDDGHLAQKMAPLR